MFSLLSLINGYIGYFSMNAKLKGQIYTILGGIGNFYLLYVAYRFFANGYYLRGTFYILAFLVLLYFAYLNALYYFTKDKQSKYDITPKIEKLLGITPKDPAAEAQKKQKNPLGFVQTNGIYTDADLLPSTLTFTAEQKEHLAALAQKLVAIGYLTADYGGLSDKDMLNSSSQTKFYALAAPKALPYFELVTQNEQLFIYGGVNEMEKEPLAQVKTVGLLDVKEALKKYRLSLATVLIAKGPYKIAGRSNMIEKKAPYELEVQIAYQDLEADKAAQ